MYDLIIIGAGPGGIALAAEACAAGVDVSKILVLEKAHTHNWAIRQLYPEQKITTANYKGFAAKCEGLLCLEDMTKTQTIEYFDKVIKDYKINTKYDSDVYGMQRLNNDDGMRFRVQSSNGTFESRVLGVAIGIFGRPNKPQDYLFPPSLRQRLLFDITSIPIRNETVLVVGGGDTAAEYVQYLRAAGNRVTLSYRQAEFVRLNDQNRATLVAMEQNREVEILRSTNIIRIDDDGGLPHVVFREVATSARTCDRVIYALGGTTPTNFLRTLGIAFNEQGPIFDEAGATNVQGLYLLGDLVVGKKGGSIITAFNSAVHAMKRICANDLSCK
ncbi:MAG TPA: NAD(P)-binding domain-containing protein [Pyrinomonadaceae bacterium]|jgi:thioredoxin reductase (NADPH)|nr:NAD(P)-binding domain-containing protein [Pyrinomonadaceae bacterium]